MTATDTPLSTGTQQESFSSFRANRGATPLADSHEDSAATTPRKEAEAVPAKETSETTQQASEPVETEQTRFEKRVSEKQRRIDELTREEKDLERRIAEKKSTAPADPSEKAAPKEKPAIAAAAYDGTDEKDPRPARPDQKTYTDWAKYETDMDAFREADAAWISRREWRKADHVRKETEAQESAKKQVNDDLATFEKDAREWAGETKADDFDDLYQEIKKRPVLSHETASVAMYGGKDGAQLLYHLMTNPQELETIEKLKRPIDRLNALYALKYKLLGFGAEPKNSDNPAPEPKRSAAPAPGTRLNGTGGGGKEPTTFAAFRAKRNS